MTNNIKYENFEKYVVALRERKRTLKKTMNNNMFSLLFAHLRGIKETDKTLVLTKNVVHNLSVYLTKPTPKITLSYLVRKRKKVSKSELKAEFKAVLSTYKYNTNDSISILRDLLLNLKFSNNKPGLRLLNFKHRRAGLLLIFGRSRKDPSNTKILIRNCFSQKELLNLLLANNEIPTIEDK